MIVAWLEPGLAPARVLFVLRLPSASAMATTRAVVSDIEGLAHVEAAPTFSAAVPEDSAAVPEETTTASIGTSSVAGPDRERCEMQERDATDEDGFDDPTTTAGLSGGTDIASVAGPDPPWMPGSSVAGPDPQSLAVHDPTSTAGLDVARTDESHSELVKCSVCRSLVDTTDATLNNKGRVAATKKPVYRCKVCNKVLMALYREMKVDAAVRSRFVALPWKQKCEWLRLHREEFKNVTGRVATEAFREHFTVVSKTGQQAVGVASFTTSFKWMDEADVKKHFEDKPLAASEVFKNAKSFVCTTTNRKLYGVPEYSAGSDEKKACRTRNVTTIVADADEVPEKPKKMPRTACRETISINHDHIPS